MTDDLMAFLRARLDEDEQTARAAAEPEKWVELNRELRPHWYVQLWADPDQAAVIADPESSAYQVVATIKGMDEDDADHRVDHIARHDPARVLRDVEAKRLLLDAYDITRNSRDNVKRRVEEAGDEPSPGHVEILNSSEAQVGALDDAIRYTATVYADHLDYREEWRP